MASPKAVMHCIVYTIGILVAMLVAFFVGAWWGMTTGGSGDNVELFVSKQTPALTTATEILVFVVIVTLVTLSTACVCTGLVSVGLFFTGDPVAVESLGLVDANAEPTPEEQWEAVMAVRRNDEVADLNSMESSFSYGETIANTATTTFSGVFGLRK